MEFVFAKKIWLDWSERVAIYLESSIKGFQVFSIGKLGVAFRLSLFFVRCNFLISHIAGIKAILHRLVSLFRKKWIHEHT